MSFLFYKRPGFLSKPEGPISATDCALYVQRAKGVERAIPDGLSFEDVVNGKSMAPCSLNEFMDYLVYIEHNAENLQFYLWYQDYVKRFNALPESQKALSPEWTSESYASTVGKDQEDYGSPSEYGISGSPPKSALTKTDYGSSTKSLGEDVNEATLPQYPNHKTKASISSIAPSFISRKSASTRNSTKANTPWQPFSIQPMRDEITQLTHYYLVFSAPRELNLSHRDRAAVLHALQHTTHPSALFPALQITESTLRGQAHPNFIRWSICNGNKPRVFLIRSVGICNTILGFVLATVLTLSHHSRWLRITATVPWFLGITNMVAAYNGLCILLHNAHVRNLRPWEEDLHDLEASEAARRSDDSTRAEIQMSTRMKIGDDRDAESTFVKSSMRTFGGKNHWDGEWLERYEKKSWWERAKGKKVWTQDQAMRLLQDRIVLSANIWGLISTVVLCAGFVAMPKGNYY